MKIKIVNKLLAFCWSQGSPQRSLAVWPTATPAAQPAQAVVPRARRLVTVATSTDIGLSTSQRPSTGAWMLCAATIFGLAAPILGTVALGGLFPGWTWTSLPSHSVLEVAGAALGLVLATLILFSRQKACTFRRKMLMYSSNTRSRKCVLRSY